MKRILKTDLLSENNRLTIENTLLLRAVQRLVAHDAPEHVEKYRDADGGRYQFRLYDSASPSGGFVLQIFETAEQRPSIHIYSVDSLPTRTYLSQDVAVSEIRRHRDRIANLSIAA